MKLLIGAASAYADTGTYIDVLDGVGVTYSTEATATDVGASPSNRVPTNTRTSRAI
jgi:hypothetical protein